MQIGTVGSPRGVVGTMVGSLLRRVDSASLRTRLALALVLAAAVPLVAAVVLSTIREERSVTEQALQFQAVTAGALAQDVADYVGLHRAAVAGLAAQSDLPAMPPDARQALLRRIGTAYPGVVVFATYDEEGRPSARSDDRARLDVADSTLFAEVRRTNAPSLEVRVGGLLPRPMFVIGAPIARADGGFAGLAVGVLESDRLADVLTRTSVGAGYEAVLVDAEGRVIARPDVSFIRSSVDPAGTPPVAALLATDDAAGSLRYPASDGERLAGYARVPGLGWGVVVERPAAAVLESAHLGRGLGFGMVILAIVVAAIVGGIAAGRLAAPLATMARAAETLAMGGAAAPLPQTGVTEVARLTAAFYEMRDRLATRTTEHEHAENEVRALNADLEERVVERTAQAEVTIKELRGQIVERKRAEKALQQSEAGYNGSPSACWHCTVPRRCSPPRRPSQAPS